MKIMANIASARSFTKSPIAITTLPGFEPHTRKICTISLTLQRGDFERWSLSSLIL